jgi:hypothetical protein
MSVPTSNEIRMTRHVRHYFQFNGGALPMNAPAFYGQDFQYMTLDSATIPEFGTIAPVWAPDSRMTDGRYNLISKTIAAPGTLPKATLTLLERHGSVPHQLGRLGLCNIYEYIGMARDISDFVNGADDGAIIYSGGRTENKAMGKRSDWAADARLEDKLNMTFDSIYPIGQMGFGDKLTTTDEALDVVYGSWVRTGEFGTWDDGTQAMYAIQKHNGGSPTSHYSLNGGKTWTTLAITGIGAAVDPDKIRVLGDYLVVTSSAEDKLFYIALNPFTGAPIGSTWTTVTAGIAAGKGITDIWVANPREAYACGLGGYLYKITDITQGVTVLDAGVATTSNLSAIRGLTDYGVVVAVGAAAHCVVSYNRGQSWALTAANPGAGTLQNLDVLGQSYFWVVDNAGAARWTMDGGATWTAVTLPGSPTTLKDVKFATKEVGFMVGANVTPKGLIYTTWNGGQTWGLAANCWRLINGFPTATQRGNSIAIPDVAKSDPEISADNIAIACLGATTTGAVSIGAVSKL